MSEILLIGGYPAAGKTSVVDQYPNHERLNRDTIGGSLADLAVELEKRIKIGKKKSFILDNTYSLKSQRKAVLDVGARNNIPVKMIWMNTSIEDAQVNACTRMMSRFGKILSPDEIEAKKDPNTFGPAVLFMFKKQLEMPQKSEGFAELEIVKFVRKANPEYKGKALILDYDGTLRKTKSGAKYPISISDIEILPGRKEILKKYLADGYKLLGASNQSGIAKGDLKLDIARACFEYTNKLLGVDIEYQFCPHKIPPIICFCRKPSPGLPVYFIEKHKLDRDQTIFVGDMTTDRTCASRAGIKYMDQAEFFKDRS